MVEKAFKPRDILKQWGPIWRISFNVFEPFLPLKSIFKQFWLLWIIIRRFLTEFNPFFPGIYTFLWVIPAFFAEILPFLKRDSDVFQLWSIFLTISNHLKRKEQVFKVILTFCWSFLTLWCPHSLWIPFRRISIFLLLSRILFLFWNSSRTWKSLQRVWTSQINQRRVQEPRSWRSSSAKSEEMEFL